MVAEERVMRSVLLVGLLSTFAFACTTDHTASSTEDVITRAEAGACTSNSDQPFCAIAAPQCPAGTTAGIGDGCWTWFCIPNYACSNDEDPGTCGGPVACQIAGPECPAGTKPGVTDDCWSGFCIPDNDCDGGSGSGSGSGGSNGSGSGSGSNA
jgi:hypothetical protein